jgi:heme/copper-type cytochrome/quinol oxidase subunit 4
MEAGSILAIISIGLFILMMLGLGAKGKDIILYFLMILVIFPLSIITIPLWGSLWLLGKIFDIDTLVDIGEICSLPLRVGLQMNIHH